MPDQLELKASTFDIIKRRSRITLFKLGKLWVWSEPLRVDNELNPPDQIAHAGRMKNLISLPFLI
jgi:hypothetical protein